MQIPGAVHLGHQLHCLGVFHFEALTFQLLSENLGHGRQFWVLVHINSFRNAAKRIRSLGLALPIALCQIHKGMVLCPAIDVCHG
jgi:hypothetical protein